MTSILNGSKLGLHLIQPGGQEMNWITAMAAGSPFSVVKGVGCPGLAVSVKAISPNTTTITRFTSHNSVQEISDYAEPDYAGIANRLFVPYDGMTNEEKSAVDFFEPMNEPSPPGVAGYERLSRLCHFVMDEANRRNAKALLYSLNAGTPEWSQMIAMANSGVFERAQREGHGMAVHDGVFGLDAVERGYGLSIPGAPYIPGSGLWCARYRNLYQLLRQHRAVVPLFITELRVNGGGVGLSIEETVRRFAWYDALIRHDTYVVAALPFTVAPTDGWRDHDYSYAQSALMTYMQSISTQSNTAWLTNQDVFNLVRPHGLALGMNFVGRIPYDLMLSMLLDRKGAYLGPSPLRWIPERDVLQAVDDEMKAAGWSG